MEQTKQETLPIPCTPIGDVLGRIYEVGNNQPGCVDEFLQNFAKTNPYLPDAKKPKKLTLDIRQKQNGTEYCFKTEEGAAIGVKFNGIDKLDGENTVAAKVLQLIFAKIIQSAHNLKTGETSNEIILTPLELCGLNIFGSEASCRIHIKEVLLKLQSLSMRVENKKTGVEEYRVMFPKISTDKGKRHWIITLDDQLPFWSLLLHYYCRFPIAGFSLKSKAFAVLRYIMVLANLNGAKINKQGYFTLTVDSLIERLQLSRKDRHKGTALVKPIKDVITEINNADVGIQLVVETFETKDSKVKETQAFLEGKVKVYVDPMLLRKWKINKQEMKALQDDSQK